MRLIVWYGWLALMASWVTTAQAQASEGDRAVIEKAIRSYVAAFNARDAKALAAHWSPEGVYISRLSGESVTGREALEKEFTALFAEVKDLRLEVATKSIDFVSPNVAIEQGRATVLRADESPAESDYSVVYVRRDGKWLIDRVSEEEIEQPASHYENLKDLEWMIGEWVDQSDDFVIKTNCRWTRNRNFILRAFAASTPERTEISGMQFVGWDPARQQIRSWVFDSDGGFADGVWEKKSDRWVVKTTATLPDGKKASSTSVFRPLDENSFGWQRMNRIVDGEILPNIDEVVIVRQGMKP